MIREVKRVLVVMAHPDDAEIRCGGTIAKWVQEGKEIKYLICTSGDKGSKDPKISSYKLGETREREQCKSAEILAIKNLTFLRYGDGNLPHSPSLRYEIATIIRGFSPNIVVTHDPWKLYDIHPDHRECGFAVCDAVVSARDRLFLPAIGEIGFPPHSPGEIYLSFPEKPNLIIDITDFIETKLSALAQHKTQTDRVPDWRKKIIENDANVAEKETFKYGEAFRRIVITAQEL